MGLVRTRCQLTKRQKNVRPGEQGQSGKGGGKLQNLTVPTEASKMHTRNPNVEGPVAGRIFAKKTPRAKSPTHELAKEF